MGMISFICQRESVLNNGCHVLCPVGTLREGRCATGNAACDWEQPGEQWLLPHGLVPDTFLHATPPFPFCEVVRSNGYTRCIAHHNFMTSNIIDSVIVGGKM